MNNDLISRSALKEKINFIFPYDPLADYEENIGEVMKLIDNAPTVDKGYAFGYADGHGEGYELGKNSRPQGDCQNCDFRKFTERFVDGVVEVMTKNGIESVEQLSEILGKGKNND